MGLVEFNLSPRRDSVMQNMEAIKGDGRDEATLTRLAYEATSYLHEVRHSRLLRDARRPLRCSPVAYKLMKKFATLCEAVRARRRNMGQAACLGTGSRRAGRQVRDFVRRGAGIRPRPANLPRALPSRWKSTGISKRCAWKSTSREAARSTPARYASCAPALTAASCRAACSIRSASRRCSRAARTPSVAIWSSTISLRRSRQPSSARTHMYSATDAQGKHDQRAHRPQPLTW